MMRTRFTALLLIAGFVGCGGPPPKTATAPTTTSPVAATTDTTSPTETLQPQPTPPAPTSPAAPPAVPPTPDKASAAAQPAAASAAAFEPWVIENLQPNQISVVAVRAALIRQAIKSAGLWDQASAMLDRAQIFPGARDEARSDEAEAYAVLFTAEGPLLLIRLAKPHTPAEAVAYFDKFFAPGGGDLIERTIGGRKFWTDLPEDPTADTNRGGARVQIDPQTLLIGKTGLVHTYMAALDQSGKSPLVAAAKGLTGKEFVSAVAVREPAEQLIAQGKQMLPPGEEIAAGVKAADELQSLTVALTSEPFALTIGLNAKDAAGAQAVASQLNNYGAMPGALWPGLRDSALQGAPKQAAELLTPFVEAADKLVKSLAVKTEDAEVKVSVGFDESFEQLGKRLAPEVQKLVAAAEAERARIKPLNNLKNVVLAAHNYMVSNRGNFPHTGGMNEKIVHPGLSWRVAILPFLEHDALCDEFHLNEPWDSEHNLKLVEKMPSIYAVPGVELESGKTIIVQTIGPKTALPNGEKINLGNVNTELVGFAHVAPSKAVIWTKPDDLEVDPDVLALDSLNKTEHGYLLGRLNGVVEYFDTIDAQTWKKLFSAAKAE